MVRILALENGEAVSCDSCHQGSMFVLDRRDKSEVSDFMSDVLVGKMKRTGRPRPRLRDMSRGSAGFQVHFGVEDGRCSRYGRA